MGRKVSRKARSVKRTGRTRPAQLFVPSMPESDSLIGAYETRLVVAAEPLSRAYGFVRGRQLEGTFLGERAAGIWPITARRTSYGWGNVSASEWSNTNDAQWPPIEPEGLDLIAQKRRSGPYQRARNLEDCKRAMAAAYAPAASLQITERWLYAEHGVIPEPELADPVIGSHAVTLVGYDDLTRRIQFANPSWGREWGDDGIGTMSYDHFRKRAVESWIRYPASLATGIGAEKLVTLDPGASSGQNIYQLSFVARDVIRGELLSVLEIYDQTGDERMAWAFAVPRDGFLDIEELFVRPTYRRRGYAGILAKLVLKTAESLERPIRLWVSFADCGEDNRAALDGLLKKLGLTLWTSPVHWSAYVGLPDQSPHELHPLEMPDRPAMSRGTWKSAKAAALASSLVAGPSETIAAAESSRDIVVHGTSSRSATDPPPRQPLARDNFGDDARPTVKGDVVPSDRTDENVPNLGGVAPIEQQREDAAIRDALEAMIDNEFLEYCAREGDDRISLEEVLQATAKIPGSMAQAIIDEERADRF